MNTRWSTSSHATYNCGYHFIWCPKYRKKVLIDGVDIRLKELLYQKAEEHGWIIEKMEVMPDHVHIFIKATPNDSPVFIISQLKGFTSFTLRNEYPWLKSRIPTLWTRSYYVETVGHISETTIKKYIEDQKTK
jgi:putative transposase